MLMYKQQGFNLVELMAVVIIIGIISAVAYPSYTNYVERANRSEGQAFLLDVAAKQERYRSQNNKYVTGISGSDKKALGLTSDDNDPDPIESGSNKYTLSISTSSGDGGYTLTAT